jgi:hypothetical protein
VDQLNAAGRAPFSSNEFPTSQDANDNKLAVALDVYAKAALSETGKTLDPAQTAAVELTITQLSTRSGSVSDQRSAFTVLQALLKDLAAVGLPPDRDLELRNMARSTSGLPLFPALTSSVTPSSSSGQVLPPKEHLLDIEIIAIYW